MKHFENGKRRLDQTPVLAVTGNYQLPFIGLKGAFCEIRSVAKLPIP
jgi:hypothetical protein